ncbi:MAG: hypothetical protein GWN30_11965, partial [Gammaproteobacteria bacterium]|nr:hypothetical protein [Gammaproteobacteria bacterium]
MIWRFRWRIALPFIIIWILFAAVSGIFSSRVYRSVQIINLENNLTTHAQLIATSITANQTITEDPGESERLLEYWVAHSTIPVSVINEDGSIIFENSSEFAITGDQLNFPEIKNAKIEGVGINTRYIASLDSDVLYVAVPYYSQDGFIEGYIRVARSLDVIAHGQESITWFFIISAFVGTGLIVLFSSILANEAVEPLKKLGAAAERV